VDLTCRADDTTLAVARCRRLASVVALVAQVVLVNVDRVPRSRPNYNHKQSISTQCIQQQRQAECMSSSS
jgi:hypothetical protein